ncbi:MAG: hypothetical protein ACO33Y_08810 [Burkholderiaceae bacterium]
MTMVVSPGQRRALVYGPVSVLHGLAVAWIANPGLSHTAIAVSLVVAVGTFVAHLLFRRLLPRVLDDPSIWPGWARAFAIVAMNFVLVQVVAFNLSDAMTPMAIVVGMTLGLAMQAYWFSQRPASETSSRMAALSIYTACLMLPFAGLYDWLPPAAIWASVAAIPAWHASRLAAAELADHLAASRLMSASILTFVVIMLTGLMLTALLPLR